MLLFDPILSSFFNKISIFCKMDKQIQILQSGFNSIIQVYISWVQCNASIMHRDKENGVKNKKGLTVRNMERKKWKE